MADAIADCQVLIAGGMGMGAYDSMKSYNIEPVVTDVKNIEEAVKLYLQGKLPNLWSACTRMSKIVRLEEIQCQHKKR